MITLRKADERGSADHGWLNSHHTFSFAGYHDPEHMGFRTLRVLNEDRVQPAHGFDTHAHRDMEILTWVLSGALEHRDSLGHGSVIRPGDVQRMSAGTGVTHSEFNASDRELLHFLQIWILPERRGLEPSYEQRHFPKADRAGSLRLVASPDARDGSVRIHQDVALYAGSLSPGQSAAHALDPSRHAWVQVASGAVSVDGTRLEAGDGAAVSGAAGVTLAADAETDFLLFDLA